MVESERESFRRRLGLFQYAKPLPINENPIKKEKADRHVAKWFINVKNIKALAWNKGRHQLSKETVGYLNDYMQKKILDMCSVNGKGRRI